MKEREGSEEGLGSNRGFYVDITFSRSQRIVVGITSRRCVNTQYSLTQIRRYSIPAYLMSFCRSGGAWKPERGWRRVNRNDVVGIELQWHKRRAVEINIYVEK